MQCNYTVKAAEASAVGFPLTTTGLVSFKRRPLSPQVSALGLDPSGARLVTGGYDYDVRFWDFAGMDQALQAFRSLQPCEW